MKDGSILSNAFNQAIRSCFYTPQKYFDRRLPHGVISNDVRESSERVSLDVEEAMERRHFPVVIDKVATYGRDINARWSRQRFFCQGCDEKIRVSAVIDAFHMVRVATVLIHPIAPVGTEKIRKYLRVGREFWDWAYIFEPLQSFMTNPSEHQFANVPPKFYFFEKPAYQVNKAVV